MSTLSILCFSLTGLQTAERLRVNLNAEDFSIKIYQKSKYLPESISISASDWSGSHWQTSDALIFVGASGIAVRSIAPYLISKKTDPAVLVIDECGNHVISLLSGHLGGANELAKTCAEVLHAVPVITTATDLHHQFAVDVFAKKNLCAIQNMKAAKEVSAAILARTPVGFYSEFPWEGELPEGLIPVKEGMAMPEVGVAVTIHQNVRPFRSTVQVIPKILCLGMGCRKGRDAAPIRELASALLNEEALFPEAICDLSSIDLKKEEPGLLALAEEWRLPFHTYSAEELQQAPGVYAASEFVQSITGIDNVCERSAVLSSEGGTVLVHKTARNGATAALAIKNWRIQF